MSDFRIRNACRLCDQPRLRHMLSLEPTPPANEFVETTVLQDLFPLDLNQCGVCGHVQLGAVVSPERLFSNYIYVSGTSPVFVRHFEEYARSMVEQFELDPDRWILEIGSNDGTLLHCFKQLGMNLTLGFEPATKIAQSAIENHGVDTINDFFNDKSVQHFDEYTASQHPNSGKAQLVIANNVFAHIDNLYEVVRNVHHVLDDKGVFVFEVSYLVDVLDKCLFDTIYHEHLSYHTVIPLVLFFTRFGMNLFKVERIDTHGGSIRCYVDKEWRPTDVSVQNACEVERGLGLIPDGEREKITRPFLHLDLKINHLAQSLTARIRELKNRGLTIAGYGAPAKATTLIYKLGLGPDDIKYIVDDSHWKQGMLTPGKHIPVVPPIALKTDRPDYLIILAWNFAESIMNKNRAFSESGGKFIVPVPELREY